MADPATCGSVFDPVGIRTFTAPCDIARVSLARSAIKYELVPAAPGTAPKVTFNGKEVPIAAAIPANIGVHECCGGSGLSEGRRSDHPEGRRLLRRPRQRSGPQGHRHPDDPRDLRHDGLRPDRGGSGEFFPTRIRYTVSLPYHIANGWFGGLLPPTAFAMVAATGDIYYGLWYPIVIALVTFVVGLLFVPETKDRIS